MMLAPLPPPYAGPEVSTRILLEGGLGRHLDLYHIRSNIRTSNARKGKFDAEGIARFCAVLLRSFGILLLKRPAAVYILLSQNRIGFLRDCVYILASRAFGCRVLVHFRGGNFHNFYQSSPPYFKRFIVWVLKQVFCVIVQSDEIGLRFKEIAGDIRVRMLPNCLDFSIIDSLRVPAAAAGKRILYVGHLSYAKGFHDLVLTIPEVVRSFPQAEFWFIGEKLEHERNIIIPVSGERLSESRRICESHAQNIRIMGVLPNKEMLEAMKGATLFVLPSYSEGFPVAILEAMACGLPVVVSRVGAIPTFVRDGVNGFLIEPGDIKALTKGLLRIMADEPLARQMAAHNSVSVRQNFSISKVVPDLAGIIKESFAPV